MTSKSSGGFRTTLDYTTHRIRAHLLLICLLMVSIINYADRTIINMVLEPIAKELDLSDSQLGILSGPVFGVCYALALIPVAHLADRWIRLWVICGALIVWSALTAGQALATTFIVLMLARAGVAIAESGSGPATNSIIGDLYPPAQRGRALAVYGTYSNIGLALGALIAGYSLERFGWRSTLMLIGIPGIVFGVMILWWFREPLRIGPGQKPQEDTGPALLPALRLLLRNPTFCWLVAAQSASIAALGATNFDSVYLFRSHELPASTVGTLLGAMGLLIGIGTLLGGWLADRLAGPDPVKLLRYCALFSLSYVPGTLLFYLAPDFDWLIAGIVANGIAPGYFPVLLAVIQLLVEPRMRARTVAVVLAVSVGIGTSLGPLTAGSLSDITAGWLGDESMRYAIMLTFLAFTVVQAFCFLRAAASSRPENGGGRHRLKMTSVT